MGMMKKCLDSQGQESLYLAGNIEVKEGCNKVSPWEYLEELKSHINDQESSVKTNPKLPLLSKVNAQKSFAESRPMHFCVKFPFWEYGAVVEDESECPLDLVRSVPVFCACGTIGAGLVAMVICRLSRDIARISYLYKIRVTDIVTALLAIQTTAYDYAWLLQL